MRTWITRTMGAGLLGAMLMAGGCAGKGETHFLTVQTGGPVARASAQEPVKIVIEPFDDRRADKGLLGQRTHLWGGVTNFQVAGERPGEAVAKALAERLSTRGWRDRAWTVQVAPAGSVADADIVITGQVNELSANAKSRVFSTVITAAGKIVIQARNRGDQSLTTRMVEGAQSRTVFWFTEDDVQELLASTVQDGMTRFLSDTMIEQRALRPVR